MNEKMSKSSAIDSALRTLSVETSGLNAMAEAFGNGLSEPFAKAIETIRDIEGRVIVTGVGKSGHISNKIAATLASTGTPAFFVHPSEANHGDLGMIARNDVILAISWSGETTELNGTLDYSKRFGIPLIALTAVADSTLAKHADVVLALPKEKEACPHNLAPTTSSMMMLAMGDAIAVALLESRNFTPDHFGVFHPGGQLGSKLLHVRSLMHTGDKVPLIPSGAPMTEAVNQISDKGFGCVGILDGERLVGIITDGDLRRNISTSLLDGVVDDIMSPDPQVAAPGMLASEAIDIMNRRPITVLMVVENEHPVGIIHLHDLLRAGLK